MFIRFASNNTTGGGDKPAEPASQSDTKKQQTQGLLSRLLTGPQHNPDGVHKQSHSSMLSVSEAIFELQSLFLFPNIQHSLCFRNTHSLMTHSSSRCSRQQRWLFETLLSICERIESCYSGRRNRWLVVCSNWQSRPGCEFVALQQLLGCWQVNFLLVNILIYCYLFSYTQSLFNNQSLKSASADIAKLCSRRRSVLTKPFSYWGEPKERDPSHIYDLRSYVLKVSFYS